MANKEFIYQRIRIYVGDEFDPAVDKQVETVLRNKLNIHLPQRATINESLASAISDHEIIDLILQYRAIG